jgi:hypothetical protein
MSEKTIIEVNGVKLEIDLRDAKRIEHFAIGSKVKILKKGPYSGDSLKVHAGIVVGFEEFKTHPTIVVAYLDDGYNPSVKMLYYNDETKETEMILSDDDYLPFERENVIDKMDKDIEKKEIEVMDLKRSKEYFIKMFGSYFPDVNLQRDSEID